MTRDADALGGSPDGERARSDQRSEAFIPYEQIEPLLHDGMTGAELKAALCRLTGLPAEKYRFCTRGHSALTTEFHAALKGGLWIERVDPSEVDKHGTFARGRSVYLSAMDERAQ